LPLLLRLDAIFETTEIWRLALEALIVGELEHRIGLEIVIKRWCLKLRVLVDVLVFRTFKGLLFDIILYF
jgi:hypothetical protein